MCVLFIYIYIINHLPTKLIKNTNKLRNDKFMFKNKTIF